MAAKKPRTLSSKLNDRIWNTSDGRGDRWAALHRNVEDYAMRTAHLPHDRPVEDEIIGFLQELVSLEMAEIGFDVRPEDVRPESCDTDSSPLLAQALLGRAVAPSGRRRR